MWILVVSDTHGNKNMFNSVVKNHPEADVVIHLGDGGEEFENATTKLWVNWYKWW